MHEKTSLISAALDLYECFGEGPITTDPAASRALIRLFNAVRVLEPDAALEAFTRGTQKYLLSHLSEERS